MFFKRSNGEFRETDRVTRFKLIKSGKNWLRASTSNFGLLKVIRGQVEETIVAEVHEDAVSEKGLTSRGFLKGIVVAAAVLSATSLVHTGHADELGKDATTASALVSAPAVTTESESLSEQGSTDQSATLNESATETKEDTVVSSELVADAPVSEDKAILEQNASEAALLINIAEKYASNHQDADQKAAIHAAVANLQSELSASTSLANATAQAYADQRARLSKSVDELMAVLTVAGFEGNTTVNGSPAVSAQLDAISTSTTLTAPSVVEKMDQPNGASIEDPALDNPNYKLDPNEERYTYSIWDLQNWAGSANQGGVTYNNGGYYVTFSVDRSTVGTTTTPVVHARLVEKATGKEVETLDMTAKSTYQFKTLVQENPTYAPQFDYTTGEVSQILGTWTNNRDAGPTSDDKYKHHILQIRDTTKPGNVGDTKPNVQTVVPTEKVTHTTHYKVEGTDEELASYAQTGIESQTYHASNPRTFEGYEFTRTQSEKDMTGSLGGVGAKYLELQGGRAHYYVKRIVEQVDKDGTSVVKLYALDPSKVSSYSPATDVNNLNLDNYTLLYTSDPVKPGGKPTPAGTKDALNDLGYVDSKDGQYHLRVQTYTDSGNGNVRLSGWYNKATGDAFTASPQFSADVDPVRNNTSNIIGGNTPGDKASGYPSFFNNYSLPSIKQISTDVTHYYRKTDATGNVYVHYQDTEGKTIKPDVTDEKDQPVNKAYDTVVDNRPNEITFEGKTYELVPAGNYKVGEVDDQGHLTSSDPTTGAVAKEDKNVTYIYKLKEGEVVITYVDENGKEIQKPRQDTPNSPYDTPYDTTEEGEKPNFIKAEDGKTYKIVPKGDYPVGKVDENGHLEKSDPVTGKVTKPKSTITYVYKEVNGNVYVHYVDTEGKTIEDDVTDEKAQPVDKDYDTVVDNRPQEIEFEGNTYELVPAGNYTVGEVDDQGHLTSSDDTTGKVIEGDKNVTYVYKLKEKPKGEVVITYVDEKGKEIQKPRQDTPNSPYDTPYNTTEEGEKPNTIKSEDGKTYKIVPKGDYPVGKVDENGHLESSDPVTGKVTKPKSTITYVYKEVNGNVYVHYVDTEGKTIKDDVTDEKAQPVDKDYDTVVDNRPQEIEFEGNTYELVPAGTYTAGEVDDQGHLKSTDPTTGKVIEGDKNVTYVYKLKEKPKGEVVITYVDENGKEIQKPRQDTPNSPYDTPYDTTEEGEKPNFIKAEDGKTYKIVPKGDYPVGKVDENGHLEKSDPVTGKVTKPKSTITYVYKEVNGNVYVHYVDTEGKTIKDDVTDEKAQPVDKDYDTVVDNRPQEIEFEGKTYELVPAGNYTVGEVDDQGHLKSTDPTTGKVIEGDKNVTYVYKLKETPAEPKGNVYVHYVDTEGKTIKDDVTDEKAQPVDKDYDTVVDNRPQEIEFEGKTYELVPAGNYTVGEVDDQGHLKSTDPTTGKVIEGDKNVTYVYKLKETPAEPKGNVYVHYVDTEGKTIKSDVTDEDAQPVDKDYDTVVDNRPQEIEFEGKTYELVPAGNYTVGEVDDQGHLKSTDPTTGKVIEGDKNVTYVYKLKEEPKGNVYVHYVDTEGKTIKSDVTDEEAQPVDKDYDTVVDNRPQEIEKDGKTYELVPAGNYTVGEVDDQGHLKSTDPTTGKVIEGDKNVTYVYKLKETPAEPKGNVYVHYVDTEGKTIKDDVTDEKAQPVDKDYDTVVDNRPQEIEKDGKTYELVPAGNYTVGEVDDQGHLKSTDPTTGKVIEGDKNVTYVYKLKETPAEPKGNVYVHYVDTEGKTIKSDVTDEEAQPVDKDYDTVVDNRPQEIEKDGKTYELVPAGNYTVGEVDDQGHLKSTDPTTGKVIEGDKNVTYVYKLKETPAEPKGNVYVHYVDTEGKTIKEDVTDEKAQPVDKDYDTVVDNRPQEIEKDGKTYELVPAGNYTVGEVDDQGHLKSTDPTTGKVIEGDKNVTYVYKLKETPAEPKGNVYVHYVDTEGKTIKSDVTDEEAQPVDKDYDTVVDNRPQEIEKDGKTYELVPAGNYTVGEVDDQGHLKSTDPTTGKVIEGDKNVTYVYKLKETPAEPKGNVYVHYVDTEGKTIKSDVTDEEAQPVDKDYDTVVDNRPQEIEKDGKTYELVPAGNYTVGEVDDQGHLKSTDPTTGKVIEGDKNVTYVYKLKETPAEPKGNVYVHYVDTEGKTIKSDVTDEDAQPVDKDYDTVVDNRPQEIEFEGKTYELVPAGNYTVGEVDDQGHLKSTDPTTGKVIEGDKNVTYVYKLKETPAEPKGNVYVHYVDTEGKTIKSDVTDEEAQPVDKDYDTVVDNRPQEIEKDGKTYELVPAGNYTVGEVDDQGHLKSTDPTTGKVIEGDKNVTYVYKLKEEPVAPKGNVYVHYVDTEGKTIKSDVTDEDAQPVDKDYDTVVDNRPQEIEFEGKTYELVPAGKYTVGEVDDQGHLKSTDPTTGKVIEGDKNVTYVYKLKEEPVAPKGNVYVHYVDTEGKTIKSDVTDEDAQPVDKDYDTVVDNRPQEIEFEGKTYELVPAGKYTVGEVDDQGHLKSTDPTTGKVIEGDKNVTYVYKLKEEPVAPKGNVYVHYVDTEGKTIKSDVTDEDAQPVDKDYDTVVDNRPQEIEFEGKTYELVPAGKYTVGEVDDQGHLKSTDPTTGKVIEGDKNVTYVYKLKETPAEPKGNVYVHYVDTEGKTIKNDVTDEDAQPVDKDYDTVVDNRPQEIEFEGKTYELVPAGKYTVGEVDDQGHLKSTDPTTGKVIEGDKNVTYVYKLKETPAEPKGNVYVHYVDTEGKTIKSDVIDEDAQPVDKDYDTVVDNRPQEIEFEGKTYELVPAGKYTVGEVDDQGHLKSTDPTTGKVIEGDKNVTYVYKLKETPAEPKGNVYVHYVDTEGKTIKNDVTDEDAQPVDKDYDTVVDNRPQEIEFEGKTYELVPAGKYTVGEVDDQGHLKSTDPTTGKVIEGDKNVTYVYKLKEEPVAPKGNVYVHYVDTEGKTIKSDVTDEDAQPVDKDYDTVVDNRPQEIEFEGKTYELVPAGKYTVGEVDDQGHLKSTDPTTGKVIEGDKNVTYVYKLKETPDKPVEPTPDKPVEPTPDKPVEPTPDKPVEPTPDKPVEPTPDKPVEPTPDKPVEPTPDKPVEPTPDKPVEPTPDKPVEPTPDKPVEPTPDKPVEPTPDKPVEPTPDKPVEPTPDKPVEPTPDKPVDPTPGKPVNPTPGKPVNPTPGKPVNPTPGKPVNPTPGKPVNPTPGKPVDPTPGKPVNPTPGKPVDPTPGKPVDPTPGKPVDPTPGKPVNPTPGKPVNPTPSKPVSEQPANPTSAKEQLPNTGETTSAGSTVLGVVAGLVGLAALGRRKKEDEK